VKCRCLRGLGWLNYFIRGRSVAKSMKNFLINDKIVRTCVRIPLADE
jgi:hypothetical protein